MKIMSKYVCIPVFAFIVAIDLFAMEAPCESNLISWISNSRPWTAICDYLAEIAQEVNDCSSYKAKDWHDIAYEAYLNGDNDNYRPTMALLAAASLLGMATWNQANQATVDNEYSQCQLQDDFGAIPCCSHRPETNGVAYGSQELPKDIIRKLQDPSISSIYEIFPDLERAFKYGSPTYLSRKENIILKPATSRKAREIEFAKKLKGTGVVPTYHGIFTIGGEDYLVVEFVEGTLVIDKWASTWSIDKLSFVQEFMAKLSVSYIPIAKNGICTNDDDGMNIVETSNGQYVFIDLDSWDHCPNSDFWNLHNIMKRNFMNNMFFDRSLTEEHSCQSRITTFIRSFSCKNHQGFFERNGWPYEKLIEAIVEKEYEMHPTQALELLQEYCARENIKG